jgi:hypothetical protein
MTQDEKREAFLRRVPGQRIGATVAEHIAWVRSHSPYSKDETILRLLDESVERLEAGDRMRMAFQSS